ncbi:MAG: dephospho-CoA kinase [Leptospiraceae bacterium]|nr:dephospho-CoA kinase [Leptospiraceae bacterium]
MRKCSVFFPELPAIHWRRAQYLIGLTGGIGAGKSTAAECFRAAGVRVEDADQIARQVLMAAETRPVLRRTFGPDIFTADGAVDRERLARVVFADTEELKKLNQLIHPGVRARFQELLRELQPGSVLVYDVPLLFENHMETEFDLTITITAEQSVRMQRVLNRNGWDANEFRARESHQLALREKEKRADLVIRNEADRDSLCHAVRTLLQHIHTARKSTDKE